MVVKRRSRSVKKNKFAVLSYQYAHPRGCAYEGLVEASTYKEALAKVISRGDEEAFKYLLNHPDLVFVKKGKNFSVYDNLGYYVVFVIVNLSKPYKRGEWTAVIIPDYTDTVFVKSVKARTAGEALKEVTGDRPDKSGKLWAYSDTGVIVFPKAK